MKFKILTFFLIITNSAIFAEEAMKKNVIYEFGFKIQKFTYIPYEFNSNNSSIFNKKSDLKKNSDIIYPFFLKFRNYDKKFGFDFDITSIRTNDPYFENDIFTSYGVGKTKFLLGNFKRDEYNFNFFYLPLTNPNLFYFGLGIKKIDRIFEQSVIATNGNTYNKINSIGFNIPIRSSIRIFDNFDINLGLDTYFTFGSRQAIEQYAYNGSSNGQNYPIIYYTYTNPNTISQISGYLLDFSFSYIIFDNFKFYCGANRNQSLIRFINSNEREFRYFGNTQTLYIYTEPKDRKFDTINNIYFGVSYFL